MRVPVNPLKVQLSAGDLITAQYTQETHRDCLSGPCGRTGIWVSLATKQGFPMGSHIDSLEAGTSSNKRGLVSISCILPQHERQFG